MRDIFCFLKLRFRNQFAISQLRDQNKTLQMQAIITVGGYGLAYFLILGYAGGLVYQMQMSNELEIFQQYLFSLLFWVFGIWTLLSGVKHIFKSSDMKQILVLPMDIWKTRLMNVFTLLVSQMIITLSVVSVTSVCFSMFHPLSFFHIVALLLYAVLIPLFSITTAITVSLLIRCIFALCKIKSVIVESVVVISIFLLPLFNGYVQGKKYDIKTGFIKTTVVNNSFVKEIEFNEWIYIVCLFLCAVFVFTLMCIFLVKLYVVLNSLFVEEAKGKKSKLKVKKQMFILVKKEFAQYVSSFVYVSNTILGPGGLLFFSCLVLFGVVPKIENTSFYGLEINQSVVYYCLFLAFIGITTTTACSLSMEGKKIWISRSLPITFFDLSMAKSVVNIMLFLPGLLIAMIDCITLFHLSWNSMFAYIILMCTHLLCITSSGVYMNLKFPKYDWISEMAVVKQSASIIVMAIVSMLLTSIILGVVLVNNVLAIYVCCFVEVIIVFMLQLKYRKIRTF